MESSQCFFNDDPQYMKSLTGKSVEIKTADNELYSGVVYVIDPESKAIVLATKTVSNSTKLDFILYHAIKFIKVTSNSVFNQDYLFENKTDPIENIEDLERKKLKLKAWLKDNLIYVEEEGSVLKLDDQLRIEYPYGPEQCLCKNTIVLDRIRTIIENMPIDYGYSP